MDNLEKENQDDELVRADEDEQQDRDDMTTEVTATATESFSRAPVS